MESINSIVKETSYILNYYNIDYTAWSDYEGFEFSKLNRNYKFNCDPKIYYKRNLDFVLHSCNPKFKYINYRDL